MRTVEEVAELLSKRIPPEELRLNPDKRQYVDGHYVLSELTAIFGVDGWSRRILRGPMQVRQHKRPGKDGNENEVIVVRCVVRLVVRMREGDHVVRVVHDDVGIGIADGPVGAASYGGLVDKANKEAVTDGIKRAAYALGDRLGLELREKDNPAAAQMIRQREAEERRAEAQQTQRQPSAVAPSPAPVLTAAAPPSQTARPVRPEDRDDWQAAHRGLDDARRSEVDRLVSLLRAIPTNNPAVMEAMTKSLWAEQIKGMPDGARQMVVAVWYAVRDAAGIPRKQQQSTAARAA